MGTKTFSGIRWERGGKPGRRGDWEGWGGGGEGWNRLQTLSRLGRGGGCLHDAIWRAAERTQVDTILHIVLFQLGQDVFSIRVLPQGGNVRPDLCKTQTDVNRMHENWKPVPESGWVHCPPQAENSNREPRRRSQTSHLAPVFFTYMCHYITVIYICATVTVQLDENLGVYFNNFSVIIHL